MKYISTIFLIACCCFAAMAQRPSGIKLLVKDKITGVNIRDSVTVTINDSLMKLKVRSAADAAGYLFFSLPGGKYDLRVDLSGYQNAIERGIRVNDGGTSYLTIFLDNSPGVKIKQKKKKRRKK